MKLDELLGEELYKQVQQRIDEQNEGVSDKLKRVRYADLSEGEYVARSKYDELDAENKASANKLNEANEIIAQLREAAKNSEDAQKRMAEYEANISRLESELKQSKLDAAIRAGLTAAGAADVEYSPHVRG